MTAIQRATKEETRAKRIRLVKEVATITQSGPLYVTEDDSIPLDQPVPGIVTMSIQELEQIPDGKVLLERISQKLRIKQRV